jgi:hypothetical protein
MTKRSSPKNSWLILTAWARPAVPDRLPNFRAGVADHNADLLDSRLLDRLDHPKEHRFVGDRDQLFGAVEGDRIQARAFAATENKPLHLSVLS